MSEIHDATFRGKKDKALKAIELGEDVNKTIIVFNNTESPLSLAIQFGLAEMVRLLLENGADPNLKVIKKGRLITPLELVFRWCEIEKVEKIRLLLQHNADPNVTNNPMGFNPLAAAVQGTAHYDKVLKESYFEIAKLLLEYGADVKSIGHHIEEKKLDAEVRGLLKEFGWKVGKDNKESSQLEQELIALLAQAKELQLSIPISGEGEMKVSVRLVQLPEVFLLVKLPETVEEPTHNLVRKIARISRDEKNTSGIGAVDFEDILRHGTLMVKNVYRPSCKEEAKEVEIVTSSENLVFIILFEVSKKDHTGNLNLFEKVLSSLSLS